MTNVREVAFDALLSIDKGQAGNNLVNDVLDKYSYLDKRDRSFLARLIEGTIERRITIDYVIGQFSKVKLNKLKPPVRTLLRMGIYQLMYMQQVPVSAAVNETVKIAKKRGLHNLSGYINGVLRNVSRNVDQIEYPSKDKDYPEYLSVYYSCPKWIVELLLGQQKERDVLAVLENSVSVRPITARVNLSKISAEALVEQINNREGKEGMRAILSNHLPFCIEFENLNKVSDIEEFNEGLFCIQDLSSMLVGYLAGIKEGDTVIDVCASPGGKSMHAADLASEGKVYSCDVSEDKLVRITENINRCGFTNVETKCLDARVRNDAFIEVADVLIADVPCSGLGVMGRKNDIKYNLSEEQLSELVGIQGEIINNVVAYVKPGGTLMYSTCTVNKNENEENVKLIMEKGFEPIDFYDNLPDAVKDETAHKGYLQLFGKNHISDGFFIAKFVKK